MGSTDSQVLLWVDRQGRSEPSSSAKRAYGSPRLSPDGRALAVLVANEPNSADVWLLDLRRDTWSRVTTGGLKGSPVWSPDSTRLAFIARAGSAVSLTTVPADISRPPEPLGAATYGHNDILDE